MLNNKIVQLCGKITDLEPAEAWENFNKAEALIKNRFPDAVVINPLPLCDHLTEAYKRINKEPAYTHYLDVCLASLKSVDYLVTLPDAHLSAGGIVEMDTCWKLGKEIISLGEVLVR